jgi:hypothetical protein
MLGCWWLALISNQQEILGIKIMYDPGCSEWITPL